MSKLLQMVIYFLRILLQSSDFVSQKIELLLSKKMEYLLTIMTYIKSK